MILYCENCEKFRVVHAKWDKREIVVYCPKCREILRRYDKEESKKQTVQGLIKLDIHREMTEKGLIKFWR